MSSAPARPAESKVSPEGDRIADALAAYILSAIGLGSLGLVVWLAIADPGGLVGALAGVLLTPVVNVLCVLLNPLGGCY